MANDMTGHSFRLMAHNLPPTPRFTLLGNWSLVKSCVSLKTATGAAWGTSQNTDMAAVNLPGDCGDNERRQAVTGTKQDFHLQLGFGDCEVGVSGFTNRNLHASAKPIPALIPVRSKFKKTHAQELVTNEDLCSMTDKCHNKCPALKEGGSGF